MTQPSDTGMQKSATPAPKQPPTDIEVRLACVDFAVRASAQSTVPTSEKDITASAKEFYNFINEGSNSVR